MTEDEARTKICHLSIIRANIGGTGKCIGSLCMAWQWARGVPDNRVAGEAFGGRCGLVGNKSND
jgi:hypothetical protein